MGAKVRGIRQAKANLDRIIKDVQGRKVVRAIQSAMLIGSAQAALYPDRYVDAHQQPVPRNHG